MSFLAAGFLLGLGAIAVPIVIHLIHRQRYPERPFTTLRFFDITIKHNVLQNRLVDKILLLLRVLALIALALGLARPFVGGGIGERRMSLVIVVDNSPSMGRAREGKPLFEHARAAAQKMVASLGGEDRAEVLLTAPVTNPQYTTDHVALQRELTARAGEPTALLVQGDNGADQAVPSLTTDAAALSAAIKKLPRGAAAALVGYGATNDHKLDVDRRRVNDILDHATLAAVPGDVRGALAQAGKLLAGSRDGDRKIVVISDLQKSEWTDRPIAGLDGLTVVTIPAETASAGANLALESVTPDETDAGLGASIGGTAVIHNYGPGDSGAAKLIVTAGDRARPVEIKLPPIHPGATLRAAFPLRLMGRDRSLLCEARIDSATDPFPYDNTWNFQVGLRPPITALCVSGGGAGSGRATFFIANALAPRGGSGGASSGGGEVMVDPRECDVAQLRDQQLFQYGVVILAGVQSLDATAREQVRQFVSDGGGLLVFPSAQSKADEYNGWDFLPAKVTEARTKDFVYVKTVADREPAIEPVKQRAGAGINTLSTNAYLALEPTKDATVLASFSNGSPSIVEGRLGRGRVIYAATGAHLSDSDWPLRPAFVILVRDLVAYLGAPPVAAPLVPDRNVGDTAATAIAPELLEGTPAVFAVGTTDGNVTHDPLPYFRDGHWLVLPPTAQPGQYVLTIAPGKQAGMPHQIGVGASIAAVSVNHSPAESDLTPLPASKLGGVLPGAVLVPKSLLDDPASVVAELYSGRDLWRWVLAGALVFLVVESLVAWRWASDSN